jgi:hypothetical protein
MRTRLVVRLLAVAASAALLAVACGGDGDEDATPPVESEDSATSNGDDGDGDGSTGDEDVPDGSDAEAPDGETEAGTVGGPAVAGGSDPCELVTAAEVAQFAGRSVGPAERESDVLCRWAINDPGGLVRVAIVDSQRYAELLDLGYVASASGVAHDTVNGSVMGLVVMDGDVGVQVGTTLPVFVGARESPGYEAHLAFARAAVARL